MEEIDDYAAATLSFYGVAFDVKLLLLVMLGGFML